MPSERKFYITVIEVTVLSEKPYDPQCLEDVGYDIGDMGECVGTWDIPAGASIEIDAPAMAKLLDEHGSDPGFFRINEINSDGVIIGCHHIDWPEIDRFAKQEGWA